MILKLIVWHTFLKKMRVLLTGIDWIIRCSAVMLLGFSTSTSEWWMGDDVWCPRLLLLKGVRISFLKKREIDWSRGGKKKKKNLHSGASKEDGRRKKKERKRAAVLSAGCPLEEEEGLGVIRPSRSLQKKKSIDRYIYFLGWFSCSPISLFVVWFSEKREHGWSAVFFLKLL